MSSCLEITTKCCSLSAAAVGGKKEPQVGSAHEMTVPCNTHTIILTGPHCSVQHEQVDFADRAF